MCTLKLRKSTVIKFGVSKIFLMFLKSVFFFTKAAFVISNRVKMVIKMKIDFFVNIL